MTNEYNNGYIKSTFVDYINNSQQLKFSNKDILKYNFGDDSIKHYYRLDEGAMPPAFCPTDENKTHAEQSLENFNKRLSMKVLSNTITSYEQNLFKTMQLDEISFRDFATIASLPSAYYMLLNIEGSKKTIKRYRDAPVLTKGNRINGNISILLERYIKKLDAWAYYADLNGSLVSFIRNEKLPSKTCFQINARVKEVSSCYHDSNILESKLNYMKVIDPSTRQKV